VNKAKRSIKALMDMRPDTANVFRNGKFDEVDPTNVVVGETIQIKVGERVPLDGEMLSDGSSFNTAALTGESKPKSIDKGETVLAGMINEQKVVEVKVTKLFNESSLARILTLVQNATGRKAKTELFIRKFARVYTPIVVFLALALTLLPYFFVDNYVFNDWLYRALIFLVISCPCALVVAIPLGYFGGIGAGSRNGILFKGSNYLDLMTRVDTIVMDKTGTLTKGVFKVQKVEGPLDQKEWVPLIAALESQSTHPIAKAVVEYADSNFENLQVSDIEEIKGHGLKGTVNGKQVLAGNVRLLDKFGVAVTEEVRTITDSIVVASVNGTFAGYITIADELKEDSKEAIRQMHASKLKTVMLSGDKQVVANKIAKALNIDQAHGDLLPEHKVMKVEEIKAGKKEPIAFVGDGINDAPVLAISDVGIAMGGLGSDAAIETADVVIQTDQPSKIVTAIKIGKATNQIVWQNIALAFGVKVIVMALGAGGLATMWEAVFADVGVALLAILNAVRIQRMRF
jgi:Zn2+/Cd2+-exporting ATPase